MPPTSFYFDFVRNTLTSSVDRLIKETGWSHQQVGQYVVQSMSSLSKEYYYPEPAPRYSPLTRQIGYVYTYLASHGFLIAQILSGSWQVERHLTKLGRLRVCAIGGGPGSEFVGLTAYLLNRASEFSELHWAVVDQTVEWSDVLETVVGECNRRLTMKYRRPVQISSSFHVHDMLSCTWDAAVVDTIRNSSLVVLNHVLSENRNHRAELSRAVSELVSIVEPGTLFIVADNDLQEPKDFREFILRLWESKSIVCLKESRFGGRLLEDKVVLEPFLQMFSPRIPECSFTRNGDTHSAKAFYAVLQRV